MLRKPQVSHSVFKININPKDTYFKIEFLSEIAKIYYPLGQINSIHTKSNILMQGLCN